MGIVAQRVSRTRGSVSIEAVVILPVFIAVLMAIVEASLWVYASALAQAAAEDGARAGVGNDALSAQTGVIVATGIVESSGALDNYEVTVSTTSESLTVQVRGESPSVIPWVRFEVKESATLPWQWP
ncbi:MAG: pilus assembly protein [Propionibacteriaceae bacterium]|jgi:Flp pilus assembly protein TadG|nr:pilus assembly protein [Propionibacteriaceae bacterium]